MDSNLDDSINLDSAMGVDFDHAEDTVVTQADITLDTSHESGIPMEFDHIEEQPMLLDAENEEIIVSDFMDDQFGMEEYSIQDDSIVDTSVPEVDDRHVIITQPDEMNIMSVPASSMIIDDMMSKPKKRVIQVKAATPRAIAAKKDTVVLTKTTAPRQVAIAPKPAPKLTGQPVLFQSLPKLKQSKVTAQYAIAPKPALKPLTMLNRPVSMVKKIPISGATVTSGAQGKTVLAQIGKQLVMMPAGGAQKIKLVTSATGAPSVRLVSDADQTQLVTENTAGTQASKPIIAKVVVQEQAGADGRGKLLPAVKYVAVQQKTVPISIANNKVVLGSPTKQGVRFAPKKHIIAMKSPTGRIMPATSGVQVSIGPKKMVITASQAQNLVLKTTAASKPTQMVAKIASASMPRTQLHQINVPGKGIQYIRLVTNPAAKTRLSPAPAQPGKTFVLTDNKGNVIQMGDKIIQGQQPPPLLVSGNINKLTSKPQQKLVRIAPLTSKPGQAAVQARSGQSLLAPLSPPPPPPPPPEEELPRLDELEADLGEDIPDLGTEVEREHIEEEPESKAALQALIADAVGEPDREHDPESSCSGSSEGPPARDEEHPLIVVPAYCKQEPPHDDVPHLQESHNMSSMINIEVEAYKGYQSPPTPLYRNPETEMIQTDLGLRPRKACNCTKSQCLKLYCDCFANGEFCNRCNCNNCHNNLENEELRQKAIRGCLDRNPNAFRPKIGKGKSGGPDIRRHNKGCNCKRSGCLKNYCECYEAKIACTAICKCVGCRNVEETVRAHHLARARPAPPPAAAPAKQPCSFMTSEVIEAVCQCLVAAGAAGAAGAEPAPDQDPVRDVIEEFARCLQDIISAAHHAAPAGGTPHTSLSLLDETHA